MKDITYAELTERYESVLQYIDRYWSSIIRTSLTDDGTLIGLPGRYVVPNNDMFQEQYYWDSYFIFLGLQHTEHAEVIVEATDNFLFMFERFKRIPNASRYYFLSRSQPPFLSSMMLMSYELLKTENPNDALTWLATQVEHLEREYEAVWRGKSFPDHREVFHGLSRYYDLNIWHNAAEAESGWDMTPRFDDRCLDFLPIDLNCLLYKYEIDLAHIATLLGRNNETERWCEAAKARRSAVSNLLWSEDSGYFYDFDYHHQKQSTFKSIAGFFALWSGLATTEQAGEIVAKQLPIFETPYGIVTTEEWHPKFNEVPKQWAWPNGWAPLTHIVITGLIHYGYKEEALRISLKWLDLVNSIYQESGYLYEKYDVVSGKRAVSDRYPDQRGFGWTNGVFLHLYKILPDLMR